MTREPKVPSAAAIILFREVDRDDRTFESRQRSGPWFVANAAHEDVYFRVKIFTEEGRKYANIEIPYRRTRPLSLIFTRAQLSPMALSRGD